MQDEEIMALLQRTGRMTFFTRDLARLPEISPRRVEA